MKKIEGKNGRRINLSKSEFDKVENTLERTKSSSFPIIANNIINY